MPPTVKFDWKNQNFDHDAQDKNASSASVPFIVFDAASESEAVSAVEDTAPPDFNGIPLKSVSIAERLSDTSWRVEARYSYPSGGSGGGSAVAEREPAFSFDVSHGEQRTLMFPIAHKSKLPADVPDSVTINDGDGVKLDSSVCTFSETHWFPPARITAAWKIRVASMYKKINSKPFRGFDPGDVRFEGCSASRAGNDPADYWQVTFKFAVQLNNRQLPQQIGDLGSIVKRGWDYLWVRYQEDFAQDNDGKMYTTKKPVAAFVEQVFEEADFREMGI